MKCTIEIVSGIYDGLIYECDSFPVSMGRAIENDISIPLDDAASRQHAELSTEAGNVYIDDLKSTNSTFVNGVKVGGSIGKISLNNDDIIKIGETCLRVSI